MSNAQPEPSMEEILASIRRIISEDDEEEQAKPAQPAPPREQAPQAQPRSIETQAESAPTPLREGVKTITEESEMLKINMTDEQESGDETEEELMLEEGAAAKASKAFESLSQSVKVSTSSPSRNLEDIVTDMLRPMLKQWLDENLSVIVEEKVEEEVQRLARRRR